MTIGPPRRLTYRWDLDKTYLDTDFDSLRGLVRIPFESAADKVAAPGVAALIRGLRASAERRGIEVRIRFVSGSPPQIGRAILEKLELDGVEHDGITFKDQWSRIRRGKFRHLREQVGYKLTELLQDRLQEPAGTVEYLFGDDWESDPLIYSLYADVIAGVLDSEGLRRILGVLMVDRELAARANALAAEVARGSAVRRIFINLAKRTPPRQMQPYGTRLVPTFNYLQTAACLFEEGVLDVDAFALVVDDLRQTHGYDSRRLVNSLRDIERRGHLSRAGSAVLASCLRRAEILPEYSRGRSRWRDVMLRLRRRLQAPQAEPHSRTNYAMLLPSAVAGAEEEARQ